MPLMVTGDPSIKPLNVPVTASLPSFLMSTICLLGGTVIVLEPSPKIAPFKLTVPLIFNWS
jgi:hypothetical protein